ncbi:transcobalamin-1-like [Mustelus asterias]
MAESLDDEHPDPSVFVSLRLLNYTLEQKVVSKLKENVINNAMDLTSGQLSLYVLALIASCENTRNVNIDDSETDRGTNLGKVLSKKLGQEIKSIEVNGYPVTNYYQVGLSFLALCKQEYPIRKSDIKTFAQAVMQSRISYGQAFSVDTAAIAALAFHCMQHDYQPADIIRNAEIKLVMQILCAKDARGIIGNIYSTGVAMQALIANQQLVPFQEWNCSNTLREVLAEISAGSFTNPIMASQTIPPTQGKTYLDVDLLSCSWAVDSPRSKHPRAPLSPASEALLEVRKSGPPGSS